MQNKVYWDRLFSNWLKDCKVAFFLIGLLMLFRTAMVIIFQDQRAPEGEILDYVLFFLRALRFDLRISLIIILPTFCLSFFIINNFFEKKLDILRMIIGKLMIIVTLLLGIGDIGFFGEYHEQYNQRVYGLFQDDLKAILETVWNSYPIVWIGIGIILLCVFSLKLFSKWMKKDNNNKNKWSLSCSLGWKLLLVLVITPLYVIGLRGGSILSRPLQREDTSITRDYFLNKLVVDPYFALYYMQSDQNHLNRATGLEMFLKDKSIKDALTLLFPQKEDGKQIDDWIKKTVTEEKISRKPKHIFLIVLESQDSWPLMDEFKWLELAPNLTEMASKGIHVKSFISAGCNTQMSLNAIITGLPDANVFTNFQPSAQKPYSTAFAKPFKDLGYKVNFFYGGHLSWQRMGELARNQGFDNTYGQEHMPLTAKSHSWGVYDEILFDYVLKEIDPEVPSVNLIMTTSNHSPYSINLKSKGCPHVMNPEKYQGLENSFTKPHIIGHLWYNDFCVGQFVKKAEFKFDPVLFVITGDHTSRRFFSSRPSLYESKSVPLIFYGTSNMLKELEIPERMAGSHLDIVPTLIESIAHKGFDYYSIGKNLLDTKNMAIGLGAGIAITPDAIWTVGNKQSLEELPWNKKNLGKVNIEDLNNLYNAFHGIGWWKIMKGNVLPTSVSGSEKAKNKFF